jgi:ABC-type nitrate/sulfonate/bicarbonate transport system permease component
MEGGSLKASQHDNFNWATLLRYSTLVASVVIFLDVWSWVAVLPTNAILDAGPVSTAITFVQLFTTSSLTAPLITAVETTLLSISLATALASVVGVPLGLFMGRYASVNSFLDPWVDSWYSIPAIAFVPLTMNWTGITWVSACTTGFLLAVFPITINVYTGVRNVSSSMLEPALSYGASQTQLISKVILPASLPNLMLGLRLGLARAVEGVIIAEMFFAALGLGGLLDTAADNLDLSLSLAYILVLALVSIGLCYIMKSVSQRAAPWTRTETISGRS